MRLLLIAALCLYAQGQTPPGKPVPMNEAKGMPPRPSPGDYQAQAKAGAVTIAADFDEHSAITEDGTYSTEDYVVVEAAVFGAPDARLKLSRGDFSLRINDKKVPLISQSYEVVARSLKDPSWVPPEEDKSKSKTGISSGGGQDAAGSPPPPPPKMPVPLQLAMEQKVQRATLLQGDRALPQAGLLFFEYRGKPKNIRSVELLYEGPAGKATLELQP
jgi:hypothetical protein